ncbi:diguanylate cyclase [Acidiferrobacter sp. SPIII_3]|nr:diguanylate cyclase [Acidiferrobacter sp. SPIII_3]
MPGYRPQRGRLRAGGGPAGGLRCVPGRGRSHGDERGVMAEYEQTHAPSGDRTAEAERLAILQVLIDVLALPLAAGPRAGPLLRRICTGLVAASPAITFAYYVVLDEHADELRPEFSAGARAPDPRITRGQAALLWAIARARRVRLYHADDPRAPAWLVAGHDAVDFVLFPFGAAPAQGIGVVGAREPGFFARVGLESFSAFTNLGDLTLTLRTLALRDPLTGLPNRALFLDRLIHACAHARRMERLLGVALLDLDGFKLVNDRDGHAAGDALLRRVGRAIQSFLRPGDTLARIGGDEFALLFVDIPCLNDLEVLCERLLKVLRETGPVPSAVPGLAITGSLGVTVFPLDDNDADTLMRHADLALYAAKAGGRDQYRVHSVEFEEAAHQGLKMRDMVRSALGDNRMVLYYQPIVRIDGPIVGAEALLRLRHDEYGLLAPEAFAGVLDSGALACALGRHVLETAAAHAERWIMAGVRTPEGLPLRISVNVSAAYLLDPGFLGDVRAMFARHPRLVASALEIEITESAPLRDLGCVHQTLHACLALGLRVALDDFGTGSASLTYLQKLPAQTLKIDRSFVRDMAHDPKDYAIVSAVAHAGHLLGLEVVAEGAETDRHLELLRGLGCLCVQGYAIARPMSADDLPGWCRAYEERRDAAR